MKATHKLGYQALKLVSYLPFWAIYLLADLVYVLMYYIIGYRKKVVFDNLSRSFPDKSADEIRALSKAFFKNLADIQLETLKAMNMTADQMRARAKFVNPELIDGYHARGITTITATSHKCNWEWMLLGASVAFDETPVDSLYKPLSSPFMESVMLKLRTQFGATMVPDMAVLRNLATRKHIIRTVAMVADQTPAKEAPHAFWFLNQHTLFFAGLEKIALATNAPVLFADVKRVKRGYYEIRYSVMAEPPYKKQDPGIIERYVMLCEDAIRNQPANWLWSHKRWKHHVTESAKPRRELLTH